VPILAPSSKSSNETLARAAREEWHRRLGMFPRSRGNIRADAKAPRHSRRTRQGLRIHRHHRSRVRRARAAGVSMSPKTSHSAATEQPGLAQNLHGSIQDVAQCSRT